MSLEQWRYPAPSSSALTQQFRRSSFCDFGQQATTFLPGTRGPKVGAHYPKWSVRKVPCRDADRDAENAAQ